MLHVTCLVIASTSFNLNQATKCQVTTQDAGSRNVMGLGAADLGEELLLAYVFDA